MNHKNSSTRLEFLFVVPEVSILGNSEEQNQPINNETTVHINAVKRADSHLNTDGFSREGLIEQLEFEGYTHDEAVYSVDQVNPDWNEQAVKSVNKYLNTDGFSKEKLFVWLEYDGYTHDEAVYGVLQVNPEWNEQAVKIVDSYLNISLFSREELIEQLEFEGFTHDEAVYGVEASGL